YPGVSEEQPVVRAFRLSVAALCAAAAACSSSAPLRPAATAVGAASITAPTPDSPADGAAAGSYRPTLVVKNGTSTQDGARLYEFQVSDRSDFAVASARRVTSFAIVANKSGVAEGAGGSTTYTPDFDLQPTTRFYWRARIVQGAAAAEWPATRSFTTPMPGFNRPGELYDPLVYGSTIGTRVGATEFVA